MFDPSKCERDENGYWKARTRDGRPVRILCADAKCAQPIVGLVNDGGEETIYTWAADGKFFAHTPVPEKLDLIVPPRKRTVTVEIWTNGQSVVAGIPEEFDRDYRESRGYKLVKTLTTEIEVP